MILSPERVSFDRITDLVYLGSRIASLDDYHRLRAQGVRACVDMKQEGADPWTFEAFLWLPTVDHEPPTPDHLRMGIAFLRQCEQGADARLRPLHGGRRALLHAGARLPAGGSLPGSGEPRRPRLPLRAPPRREPQRRQIKAAEEAARSYEA